MSDEIVKIVVIGPESTGKSTLCEKLAAHYNTIWVKEYAREYLMKNGTSYTQEDLLTIAKGQIENEEYAIRELTPNTKHQTINNKHQTPNNKLLIIDTDMYVMKVWSEFVFNACDHFILNQVAERKYHSYLLCEPDIDWVKDELREYPDLKTREILFHHYKDLLSNQHCDWTIINGDYESRFSKAKAHIDKLFQ